MLVGQIRFGNIHAQGVHVRAAGLVLTLPFIMQLFLSFMVGMLGGGDGVRLAVYTIELFATMTSMVVAYMLIFRHPNTVIGQGKDGGPRQTERTARKKSQPERTRFAPIKPVLRRNLPSVMSTVEAASYLNITEQALLNLIIEGKIAAARINYRYKIARTVLDDFKNQQESRSGDHTGSF